MGVGAGLYMYDVVVKSDCSRSLSHLVMSSCFLAVNEMCLYFCAGVKEKHGDRQSRPDAVATLGLVSR